MKAKSKEKVIKQKFSLSDVEAEISVTDVGTVCNMADCFQVHTLMGMVDGISGKTEKLRPFIFERENL